MTGAWTWPAYVAVLLGTAAFVLLFVPVVAFESRRFGEIRPGRVVGAAMISVYGVALIAYTLLPLPDAEWCRVNPAPGHNLRPFEFLRDIRAQTAGDTLREALTSFVFLQVAFNVLLFVPWGAFMRRFYGRGVLVATLSGAVVSMAIEATQGTGAFRALPCAYRVADVDDVILNTVGALVGGLAAPLLLRWLPDPRRAARPRAQPRAVTRRRRLAGMVIDLGIFTLAPVALAVAHRAVVFYLLGEPMPGDDAWLGPFAWTLLVLVACVYLPAFIGSGASLGQRAVWLEPRWPTRRRRAARMALGFGAYATLTTAALLPPLAGSSVAGWLSLASNALALGWFFWVAVDPSGRGGSFRLSGARLADTRSPNGGRASTL